MLMNMTLDRAIALVGDGMNRFQQIDVFEYLKKLSDEINQKDNHMQSLQLELTNRNDEIVRLQKEIEELKSSIIDWKNYHYAYISENK